MSSGVPSETAQAQAAADSKAPSFASLGIKNTDIKTATGVTLSDQQKVIVGSVLDVRNQYLFRASAHLACPILTPIPKLFEGNPTLKHFSLWSQNGTFTDPLTVATGYPKYTAQFYGLPALFKPIQIQSHKVISSGNPIEFEMSNKYTVKGINKDQVMDSIIKIHLGSDGKIEKVEDKWNGELPDGPVSSVSDSSSSSQRGWPLSPFVWARWALRAGRQTAWWAFCTFSWWLPFLVGHPACELSRSRDIQIKSHEELLT